MKPNYIKTGKISHVHEQLASKGAVLLKIGHNNCRPCVIITPVIEELASQTQGMSFVDYDVSFLATREPEPSERYFLDSLKLKSVPHFVLYYKGVILNHNSPMLYGLVRAKDGDGLLALIPKDKIQGEGEE